MAGGRASKRKGYTFEAELVASAREAKLQAERAWGSNGVALRCHSTVDAVIAGQRLQAKRRRIIPSWLGMSEYVDAVAVREDRGETFVLVRWNDWLDMVGALEREKTQ